MKVTVVFLARALQVVGKPFVQVELEDDATLETLLEKIGKEISPRFYRGVKEGRLVFAVFMDGKPIMSPKTELRDGARIVFTTPEMGG